MIGLLRSLPRTMWLLGAISLLNDSASDMIYPLVPLYLASVLMAGPKALGLIEGVAEALSSLLKLAAGVLADRSRQARGWVIGAYAMASLARPLIGIWLVQPGRGCHVVAGIADFRRIVVGYRATGRICVRFGVRIAGRNFAGVLGAPR